MLSLRPMLRSQRNYFQLKHRFHSDFFIFAAAKEKKGMHP